LNARSGAASRQKPIDDIGVRATERLRMNR
jgi:hypothetical protein